MGPLGWPEIIIILVVLLLLFGAKRLPEMGRSLGRGMREFKDAVTGNEEPKQTELNPPPATPQATPASPAPTKAAPPQQNERAAS
jgi:TatA/E family protein of Tat protein translocase